MKSKQLVEGQKFNRLTIIKLDRTEINKTNTKGYKVKIEFYLCKCDCGNICIVRKYNLLNNHTKSCGCYKQDLLKITHKKNKKYLPIEKKLYLVLAGIKTRCLNKNDKHYKNYGNRGIIVCDEWKNDFKSFYDWSMANGYIENEGKNILTIDRIDNNKGYSPDNCRWVNMKTQARNRRNNRLITYNGETHCVAEWAEINGIKDITLRKRIKRKGNFLDFKKYKLKNLTENEGE